MALTTTRPRPQRSATATATPAPPVQHNHLNLTTTATTGARLFTTVVCRRVSWSLALRSRHLDLSVTLGFADCAPAEFFDLARWFAVAVVT